MTHTESMETFWTNTYQKAISGFWGKVESVSGPGSSIEQTKVIQKAIGDLIHTYEIKTILDVPCGDFNWMNCVDLKNVFYIGVDIVRPMIEKNILNYGSEKRKFECLDVTIDELPLCDLIICRDLLVHFSTQDVFKAIHNFKKSGAKYLLTTTFVGRKGINAEIKTGGWCPINLQNPPFNFPKPDLLINEHCTEQNGNYNDKSLALWKLDQIES